MPCSASWIVSPRLEWKADGIVFFPGRHGWDWLVGAQFPLSEKKAEKVEEFRCILEMLWKMVFPQ